MARLRRSDTNAIGITRRKVGRGFAYAGPDGRRLTDPPTIDRIRALAIPPAWKDVWICPWPNGHIQALGTDARGRRPYRYHDDWRKRRDAEKFEHMVVFARTLPTLRSVVSTHLQHDDMTRERVLACATRLLELGFFRIGSEGYAEENNSFGLATMRKKHVSIDDSMITFDYTAKSGKRRIQSVVDPQVADIVRELKGRRGGGYELLAYRDGAEWRDLKSTDINSYLKEHTSEEISAKDFRTWNATVLCAIGLARSASPSSMTAQKRVIAAAVREVSEYLGNTPAVCRNSYIDPRIIDRFRTGDAVALATLANKAGEEADALELRDMVEDAIIDLLDGDERSTLAA